ncbi:MAG: TetR/AcrR family transcriptional regulator, partial [Bacteroidetes bacterium]
MLLQDDIKENILDVAQSIFRKYGFKKTTMDEIAKAARKGKSTLYYYFKSKEEIFAAVIEKEGNYMQNELMRIVT